MIVTFQNEGAKPLEPVEELRIRFSEISTFLKCRKMHQIQWVRQIEPRKTDDRMLIGTWGHAALKALFLGNGPAKEVKTEIDLYREGKPYLAARSEHDEMGRVALACAEKAYKAIIKEYEPVMVEETLFFDYGENVQLTGTPDVILRERATGLTWLFDHKFRKNFRPPDSEVLNLQMVFYAKLLELVKGITVVGSKQLQIHPFEPKVPKVTLSGKLSKQNITSDWATYCNAVLANGENPDDYLDMKAKLADHVFFEWDSLTCLRSPEELDSVWTEEIKPAADSIVQAHRAHLQPARCFDFGTCNFCSVKELCVAEMKGEDTSIMLKQTFKHKGEKSQFVIIDMEDD